MEKCFLQIERVLILILLWFQLSELERDREVLHEIARKDKSSIHDLNIKIRELQLSERSLTEQVCRVLYERLFAFWIIFYIKVLLGFFFNRYLVTHLDV